MNRPRKIASHYALCPRSGWIASALLSFDADGVLLSVEQVENPNRMEGVEFYGGVLVPSMVNAHCHLELSYLKGQIPEKTGLPGFVGAISRIRDDFSPDERLNAASVWQDVMWRQGICAVGDICNDGLLLDMKKRSPMTYHNFIELFGIDPATAQSKWKTGQFLLKEARARDLPCSLTPHSLYSLSEELLSEFARIRKDRSLSVHFMESPDEAALFRGEGFFADTYRKNGLSADFTRYGSPAGRLISAFHPDTPLLLVHNTFVTEEEIERLTGYFTDITWVLCPRSNLYIEDAFPPVGLLRKKGVKIAVGTDSLASNTSLSVLDELKYLTEKTDIPLQELISWATMNGAQGLQAENFSGTFRPGEKCGAVLLTGMDWGRMSLTPEARSRRMV